MTAALLAIFFIGTSLLHLAWAGGLNWGLASALPENPGRPALSPSSAATVAVAVALGAAGTLVLVHAGLLPRFLPPSWSRLLLRIGSAVFLLRAIGDFRVVGFFKKVRSTRFATADTIFYSPLCAAVAIGLWALART